MSDVMNQVVLYINGIFLVSIKYYAFADIFKLAVRKRISLLAYIAFLFITTQIFFEFPNIFVLVATNLIAYNALTFLFYGNVGAKLILATLLYATGVIADFAALLTLNYVYSIQFGVGVDIENVLPLGRTISSLFHLPFALFTVFIFRRIINKSARNNSFKIPTRYTASILLILLGIILVNALYIAVVIDDLSEIIGEIAAAQLISSGMLLLIIWVFNTILTQLKDSERIRQKNQMLERWELQYNTLASSQKMISELKHNLKYHFLLLSSFLEKGEPDNAKLHIDAELGKFDLSVACGNIAVDTILNFYLNKAKEELGIELNTEITVPPDMLLDSTLIVTILGNALENAVEACKLVDIAGRYIDVKAVYTPQKELIITIKNSYEVEPIMNKQGQLLTTKADKRNHGIGLSSIREILPKQKGNILIEFNEKNFCFILHFYHISTKNVVHAE